VRRHVLIAGVRARVARLAAWAALSVKVMAVSISLVVLFTSLPETFRV
jgi:hypothetical protein